MKHAKASKKALTKKLDAIGKGEEEQEHTEKEKKSFYKKQQEKKKRRKKHDLTLEEFQDSGFTLDDLNLTSQEFDG